MANRRGHKEKRQKLLNQKRKETLEQQKEKERLLQRKKNLASLVVKLEQLRRIRVKRKLGEGVKVDNRNYFDSLPPEYFEKVEVAEDMRTEDIDEDEDDYSKNNSLHSDPNDFYYRAYQSVEQLVKIRASWDAFIVPAGVGSKIPPHWLEPPDPSSEGWKSYVVSSGNDKISVNQSITTEQQQ
eukprot:TRINITY_DN6864_c0_g1_i1.p1 TRINITY_DN6864_c0_g1~~TRINITY_DN6864_c0_g1_i1.p1  ORF type:complete len:183 (+),score=44.25 TRINITY_DN6864_c0_g1_i1:271-819(+)